LVVLHTAVNVRETDGNFRSLKLCLLGTLQRSEIEVGGICYLMAKFSLGRSIFRITSSLLLQRMQRGIPCSPTSTKRSAA
jgi:hypothetical protein